MKIPKQARREATRLFRSCLAQGVLDEHRVRQALQEVIARKPRGFVPVLSHFQRLVKLEVARRTARVETAVPLSPPLQAGVAANLARAYGTGLSLSFAENRSLIGGLRIRVGSDVYDGSVQA
ncbi:MAG: F0F1 ATP synthase subunit delta, partial [Chloroflexi bacterium]|nr:F0F1 ATP synthase subunit delta [Chloroflexota bacterium]